MNRPRCFVGLILGLLAGACGAEPVPLASYVPPKPATVKVTMVDYDFVFARRIPAGRVVFNVTNAGRQPHRLTLLPLGGDTPPIGELLQTSPSVSLTPLEHMPMLPPGQTSSFAVELAPGARYAMASFWPSQEEGGTPDALLGMTAEFRTRP